MCVYIFQLNLNNFFNKHQNTHAKRKCERDFGTYRFLFKILQLGFVSRVCQNHDSGEFLPFLTG